MRRCVFILSALLIAGCSSHNSGRMPSNFTRNGSPTAPPPTANRSTPLITQDNTLVGKIVRVNWGARFAVITFPVGHVPAIDTIFGVYRQGLKVGEVKITGPQEDENTVGDIVTGEAQLGDELRSF